MTQVLAAAIVAAGLAPGMVRLLEGPDRPGRAAAVEELSRMGKNGAAVLRDATYQVGWRARSAIFDALSKMGAAAIPAMVEIARSHPKEEARRRVIRALGELRGPAVRDSLIALLGRSEDDLIVQALGKNGDSGLVDQLAELLNDTRNDVRRQAVIAVAGLAGPAGADRIVGHLSDDAFAVRFAASEALVRLGPEAGPAILQRFEDLPPRGRYLAIRTLGRIGSAAAVPQLTRSLQAADWALRAAAGEALARIRGKRARDLLSRTLDREPHPFARDRLRATLKMLAESQGG